jgi:hypothetical protein
MYRNVLHSVRHDLHDVHKQLEEISKTLAKWTHAAGLKILNREDRKQYREELRKQHEQRAANDPE